MMSKYEAYLRYSIKMYEPLDEAWKWALKANKCIDCAAEDLIENILSNKSQAVRNVIDTLPEDERGHICPKEITKAFRKAGYVRSCRSCKKRQKSK
jgi:hypothetical protein